jgi:beta-xylosidase
VKRITVAVASAAVFLFVIGCSGEDQPISPSGSTAIGDAPLAKIKCPTMEVIFQSEGGVKDFTVIKRGTGFHIFHITDPLLPEGGTDFGHAMSANLLDWTYFDRIDLRHEDWSGDYIWAPHVIEEDGVYYMFYTGVEVPDGMGVGYGYQRIGLATSTDLATWTLYNGNGLVLDGPWHDEYDWCAYGTPGSWNHDCRDPFVFNDGDEYVMFVTIRLYEEGNEWPPQAIAVAKSPDLFNWTWSHYIPVTTWWKAESPNLVKYENTYFLMWTTSDDGDIKIASAADIDGPYTLRTSDGLYGYANETFMNVDYMIYAAVVDDYDYDTYDLRLKKIEFSTENPVATTFDFTTCDFYTKKPPYNIHDPSGGDE